MQRMLLHGVKLAYDLRGPRDAPTVVLVHGSWTDHHAWDEVAAALAGRYRVLTYDRRGHSESSAPTGQGHVGNDVLDAAGLLEALDLGPAAVVGNSFGAIVALRLAAERPDMVRTLVAHEPPLVGLLRDDPLTAPMLAAVGAKFEAVLAQIAAGRHERAAELFVEEIAFGPGGWASLDQEERATFARNATTWLDEMRDTDALTMDLGALARYSGPALLTQGGHTAPFFPRIVEHVAKALPGAQRHFEAAWTHVPQATHPAQYASVVGRFLDEATLGM